MKNSYTEILKKKQNHLNAIGKQNEKMSKISNNIWSFSKIEDYLRSNQEFINCLSHKFSRYFIKNFYFLQTLVNNIIGKM